MRRLFIMSLFSLLLLGIVLQGYSLDYSYYITGTKEQRKELKKLFSLLEQEKMKSESKFIIIQQISKTLHSAEDMAALNLFLTTYVEKYPNDPFNAYYLFITAQNYMNSEAYPFAAHYYERILKNYPDLLVQGKSIHYFCLKNLLKLIEEPEIKVNYYKELIARFSDEIDKGITYYQLAKTYENIGEWELAIQAYNNFLNYPDTVIPGNSKAFEEVKAMVDFYNYDGKDWTMESLEELVKNIRSAILSRSSRRLQNYMAKVNFFTMTWEQGESFKQEQGLLENISDFLVPGVWCYSELDKDSNEREAYLKTTGWSYRIRTWYLYFRKIHFPADPEKHGQWEWAGIYFGEKIFAGTTEED